MALLEVENLSVRIGPGRILEGIDLTMEAGESLGLVGESGCGKSMTALAIMGLQPDTALLGGSIRLDGRELLGLNERAYCRLRGREIGMVFQEPMTALNPVQTIGAQVAEGLRLHLRPGRHETEQRTRRLLDRVGLPAARFSPRLYPHQLSGGQRQRVVIAMALACEPKLLIADEPTTALDVTIQAQILDLIAGIVAEENMGLLLITHDLGVIAEMTDRVAVMYAGHVVESAPTLELFRHMAHPYTHGLFRAMPQAHAPLDDRGGKSRLATIPGQVPDLADRPPGCIFADRCDRVTARCRKGPLPLARFGRQHHALCHHPLREEGA